MTKSNHGGARPKVRDDDKRGGARPGSGPKRKWLKMQVGQWVMINGTAYTLEQRDGGLVFIVNSVFVDGADTGTVTYPIDGPFGSARK